MGFTDFSRLQIFLVVGLEAWGWCSWVGEASFCVRSPPLPLPPTWMMTLFFGETMAHAD